MLWLLLLQAAGAPLLGPTPIGDPSRWFVPDQYPRDAMREAAQGVVLFDMSIDEKGRAVHCTVLRSSVDQSLDRAGCDVIRNRGRWTPEQDEQGRSVFSVLRRHVAWSLPDTFDPPPMPRSLWTSDLDVSVSRLPVPPEKALVGVRVLQRADGTQESCQVVQPSALPALDKLACTSAATLMKHKPILDAEGEAVPGVRWRKIRFVAKPPSN
jgi:TonB family protein